MTNEELYDRMRQQRMLREELRDKKKELEDMMRKEHALKQNSSNQDTQSDVISYSNKSDQFGSVQRYVGFSCQASLVLCPRPNWRGIKRCFCLTSVCCEHRA